MLSTLQCIYGHVQCCVRMKGVKTDWFNVSSGLKQGCHLSPILFKLYLNDLFLWPVNKMFRQCWIYGINGVGHGVRQ